MTRSGSTSRRPGQGDEAPECYGTGLIKIPLPRYPNAYDVARVQPTTCFTCPVEGRCLAQQRVRRP